MDFSDTPGEAKFRAEARAFLERHTERLEPGEAPAGPFIGDDPDAVLRSREWQARKFDHGWACLTWPAEFGGRGLGPMEQVIWTQEELRFRTPVNIFSIGIGMLGPTLMKHGTEFQEQRYLKKMARGDEVWCQLYSEPGAGIRRRRSADPGDPRRRGLDHRRPEDLEHRRPLLPVGESSSFAPTRMRRSTGDSPASSSTCSPPGSKSARFAR